MESTLPSLLTTGRYLDILLSDSAGHFITEFVSSLKQQRQAQEAKQEQQQQQVQSELDGPRISNGISRTDVTAVGLAALNAFLQANVTGPVLEEKGVRLLERRFLDAADGADGAVTQSHAALRRTCLRLLDVDGVSAYEHVPMVEVFCLARWILCAAPTSTAGEDLGDLGDPAARSPAWLALRVHVWHYKLLTQPSLGPGSLFNKTAQSNDVPNLQDRISKGLEDVEEMVVNGQRWSAPDKVRFLVEKANVCILLGHNAKAKEALRRATEISGLVYALSGALGKRTRFQEKSTSQLVVLAKSGDPQAASSGESQANPQSLALNDDTLLENLEFTKDEPASGAADAKSELPEALRDLPPDEQPQLSPLDQIILLADATLKDAFSPTDTLTSEEVLPFAVRVISDKSTNWQIYTHALLVRSRIELHRSRTVERGVLQMQAVVDQVIVDTTQPAAESASTENDTAASDTAVPAITVTTDGEEAHKPPNKPTSFFPAAKPTESAPAHVRLEYIHALSSPPRWHLESELAYSWASVGSLVSALEIFKRLRLWAEVALCFAANAARDDEDGRGSSGEAKAKAVVRWRLFHKTGAPAEEQGAADDEEVDLDDLKEADYHGPERQPPPPNAPRLWCILGDLEDDPAHYERAWEVSKHRFARAQKSLGEYHLRHHRDLVQARDAYEKAVAVNRQSTELWNRLGDISLRLGDFSGAVKAFSRAIATSDNVVGGEDARTWSNLGSALYSLYVEHTKHLEDKKKAEQDSDTSQPPQPKPADSDDSGEEATKPLDADPSRFLTQALAAYKRGARIAGDNWRIWDNVVTLATRLRPVPVADVLLGLHHVLRLRASEDALDVALLRNLLAECVLAHDRPAPKPGAEPGAGVALDDLPRGSAQRAVCDLLENKVAPVVTKRSEVWELVARERAWRGDYAGAVDAAERAWRAALAGLVPALPGAGASSLSPASAAAAAAGGSGAASPWADEEARWETAVTRTEELVAALENYGARAPGIGERWRGKARSAVRSVVGKGRERWEGEERWERLVGLLEELK